MPDNWAETATCARLKHEGGGLDGARQRQDIDPRGLRPLSARAHASAVAPVVMTSSTTTSFLPLTRAACALSTLNAPLTLRRRCSALSPTWLAGPPHPPQHRAIDGNAGEPADRQGQHGRLVEASPPQPRGVVRHRHDEIGVGEQLGPRLVEPAGEQGQSLMPIAIFEALDKLAHGVRIARRCPRAVVDWRRGDCRRRQQRLARLVGSGTPSLAQSGGAMKSMLAKQAPQSSPWLTMRRRQEMQTGGSRRSASRRSIGRIKAAPAPPLAVAGEAGGSRPSSASPVGMAL
jgi:hypothetical protein